MGKNNKTVLETAIEQADPYRTGLYGSTIDLYLADAAAKADIEVKEAAHLENSRKSDHGMSMFHSYKKYERLRDAYRAAQMVPYTIHRKLYEGAFQAFLDDRPENLQEILAHPEEFRRSRWESAGEIISNTIIALIDQNPDPAVPGRALAKIDESERQRLLNNTLYELIYNQRQYGGDPADKTAILLKAGAKPEGSILITLVDSSPSGHIEKTAALLLKSGIKPDGAVLAALVSRDAPQSLQDLILKNGVTYDDALKALRDNPGDYSTGAADKLELAMAKQTITQLKSQLTGQPPQAAPAQQAPAEEPAAEVYKGRPREIRTRPIRL